MKPVSRPRIKPAHSVICECDACAAATFPHPDLRLRRIRRLHAHAVRP